MRRITVLTPCYNEEANVSELHRRIVEATRALSERYVFDHLFIDNASTDGTVEALRTIAKDDPSVKVIVNERNFGHIRSPYHALLQTDSDAVITLASDLQDPPELIPQFVAEWEAGYRVVVGVKTTSEEPGLMRSIRTSYYRVLRRMSDIELVEHFTGFGLYDKRVIDLLRTLDDPYPYFRGQIAELGFKSAKIPFNQPSRKGGITKNNFYTLFDMAMLGFTNHSKLPLRMATFTGFVTGFLSFLVGLFYLGYKLYNWNGFTLGLAPMVIGLFFFASVQLIFLGVVGEYVGAIYTHVHKRPLVVEKERINFAPGEHASRQTELPILAGRTNPPPKGADGDGCAQFEPQRRPSSLA